MQVPLQHRPVDFLVALQCMQNLSPVNLVRHIRELSFQNWSEIFWWLRLLVASFPPRRSRFEPRLGNVGFMVDKVALGQVFYQYFSFLCQFSLRQLFHTIVWHWYDRTVSGRHTKWTQSHPTSKKGNKERYFDLALSFPISCCLFFCLWNQQIHVTNTPILIHVG
jgi:hypothetical protein